MLYLAAFLSIIMGITLGLLGGGGSILTVPILRYALDIPAKATIATSLLVVGSTAAIGLIPHARKGNVVWKTGAIFAGFAMAGAFAGGHLAQFIPGPVLLLMFGGLMLVTGVAMLRKKSKGEDDEAPIESDELLDAEAKTSSLEEAKQAKAWWMIGLEGLVVGLVTGMVGAGGGFLVVPALVLLGGLGMVEAVGTSLFVIAAKSFAGFAGYAAHVEIDWALTAIVTAAAAVGTIGGAWIAQRVKPDKLRQGFAYFVFVMALVVIYKEATAQFGEQLAGFGWQTWALVAAVGALAVGLMAWFWRMVAARRGASVDATAVETPDA